MARLVLIMVLLAQGCAMDDAREAVEPALLDTLVEQGLEMQPQTAVPVQEGEDELAAVIADRRALAEGIRAETATAVAPMVVIAAIFAPEGAADLALQVLPVHKLGKGVQALRKGLKLHKKQPTSDKLAKLYRTALRDMSPDAADFVRLANRHPRIDGQEATRPGRYPVDCWQA